jgi:hypothetical protein
VRWSGDLGGRRPVVALELLEVQRYRASGVRGCGGPAKAVRAERSGVPRWGAVSRFAKGPMSWPMLARAVGWSHPTLRRASKHLLTAGCIAFDRKTGQWRRVTGVVLPPSLWPRHMLVDVVERAFAAECQAAPGDPALDTPAEL